LALVEKMEVIFCRSPLPAKEWPWWAMAPASHAVVDGTGDPLRHRHQRQAPVEAEAIAMPYIPTYLSTMRALKVLL
jgi:hypothetical protein